MALIARESCKKTFARTAISLSTRFGSPREEVRRTADIQRLPVTLLTSPYVRRSRNCASTASTLSAPPQHRIPQTQRKKSAPIVAHILTNACSKSRVVSLWHLGLASNRRRRRVGRPCVAQITLMRACTPLHRPPPAVSNASRCHTYLYARRALGNAYFALQSENVVKIVQTSTPPENRKPLTIVKKSAPVASLHPMHAWLNCRGFSPWGRGSDKGWAKQEKVWGLWRYGTAPIVLILYEEAFRRAKKK
jgi:hypothetical protein